MDVGGCHCPVPSRIPPSTIRITTVLMKVAKSESIFSMPILAKMAVSAAKAADSKAQNCHDIRTVFMTASMP